MKLKTGGMIAGLLSVGVLGYTASKLPLLQMGKQPDGAFIVSSGQRIEPGALAFDGRPVDIALHPSGSFFAVLNQRNVFLANREGVLEKSKVALAHGAGFHGVVWHPDGKRLFVSVSEGYVQELVYNKEGGLDLVRRIEPKPQDAKGNARPGGMVLTKDGSKLFVVAMDRNTVAEIDVEKGAFVREFAVQNLPFDVKLSADEQTLLVTNWGGRLAAKEDKAEEKQESVNALLVIDPRGATATGTFSLVNRSTGKAQHLSVGLHPTSIAVRDNFAYIANAASDSLSVVNISGAKAVRTIPLKWGRMNLFGSMPSALAISGDTLYVCNGGDNALCEVDLKTNSVRGYRPAGYYPMAVALSTDGKTAFVLNTKGNGSVRRTVLGQPGNAHDYQGTVSILDLTADLKAATEKVAANNGWNRDRAALRPKLAVYNGAVKHVLYIIKENRTYDEVFGDLPQGNGDKKLCGLGEEVTPNHHALATQFTLFDNGYVSGTNSADGHSWSNYALANDYLEHFYTGYRTYPDDGTDAMGRPPSNGIWSLALNAKKSVRVYGEFCDDEVNKFVPEPKDWKEVWEDRKNGTKRFKPIAFTQLPELKKVINPEYLYWPLTQSDQARADIFITEYNKFSKADKVPNLMVMSLPSDHTEGLDPKYPKPKSMVADNDLALGRIVEAVSKSPQWKDTCIFVIEDDAQAGPDHVDGHRTVYMAISPYTRRQFVDSTLYTTVSMLRSIELMLNLPPMNRFDALTPPLTACFTDTPDLTPYRVRENRVALGDMNKPVSALRGKEREWARKSLALDWSGLDRADFGTLNRIVWHSLHGYDTPYPERTNKSF